MDEEGRAASGPRAASVAPSPESAEAFVQLLMSGEGSGGLAGLEGLTQSK